MRQAAQQRCLNLRNIVKSLMHCLAGWMGDGHWPEGGAAQIDLSALAGRQEQAGAIGGLLIDHTLEGEALTESGDRRCCR